MDPTLQKKTDLFKEVKPTDHSEAHSVSVQSCSVLITAKCFIVQAKKQWVKILSQVIISCT